MTQEPKMMPFERNERGVYEPTFMYYNRARLKKEEDAIVSAYCDARNEVDLNKKIKILQKALRYYNGLKKWCYRTPEGKRYFDGMWENAFSANAKERSYGKQIENDIKTYTYRRDVVIPGILEKARSGILQSELYKLFGVEKDDLRIIINGLERSGKIIKKKSGRTYLLKLR